MSAIIGQSTGESGPASINDVLTFVERRAALWTDAMLAVRAAVAAEPPVVLQRAVLSTEVQFPKARKQEATAPQKVVQQAAKLAPAKPSKTADAHAKPVMAEPVLPRQLGDRILQALLHTSLLAGVKARDLAKQLNVPQEKLRTALYALKDKKLVVLTGTRSAARWALPKAGQQVRSGGASAVAAKDVEFEVVFSGGEGLTSMGRS